MSVQRKTTSVYTRTASAPWVLSTTEELLCVPDTLDVLATRLLHRLFALMVHDHQLCVLPHSLTPAVAVSHLLLVPRSSPAYSAIKPRQKHLRLT